MHYKDKDVVRSLMHMVRTKPVAHMDCYLVCVVCFSSAEGRSIFLRTQMCPFFAIVFHCREHVMMHGACGDPMSLPVADAAAVVNILTTCSTIFNNKHTHD